MEETNKGEGAGEGGNKQEQIHLEIVCKYKDRPTPCLDFHIEKCSAPCIGRRTTEEYHKESVEGVLKFLKGDYGSVRPVIRERMEKAAADRLFELAAQFRDYLQALDRLEGKQLITDTSGGDSDIIAVAVLSGRADVVVMQRRGGRLIGDRAFSLAGHAESPSEVLEQFLPQFYEEGLEIPEEILVSAALPGKGTFEEWLRGKKGRRVRIVVPVRGRKSQLLQLAEKNVLEKARQREAKWEAEKRNTEAALLELTSVLELPHIPKRIEGYDISHLGGTETVGSMTVMIEGKARNDHYRSFTIRTMKAGEVDDYKALKEVLLRRLRHLTGGLKQEEQQWKAFGMTFGKAKKAEQRMIEEIHARQIEHIAGDQIDYRQYLVARHGSDIVAFGRLRKEGTVLVLRSVWVHDAWRGRKLGQFLSRKILQQVKKGKVYVRCIPSLEYYYAQIGFRYVIKPPPVLQPSSSPVSEDMGGPLPEDMIVMVWDASQNKPDLSLTSRPDLLVIDGGKGQLSAALEVLKVLKIDIPVIGLAKREEEVFIDDQKDPVIFPPESPAKFLLMRLRDEAHRFANRHREARGKQASKASLLDAVPGLGEEGKKALLRKFGSISAIRDASDEELGEVVSELQVREVRRHLS
ncbi:MAG: GNAT family N-acetyltransferase [Patescibacteria group bacterium]